VEVMSIFEKAAKNAELKVETILKLLCQMMA
jgi:hypothetical protein